MFKRNIAADFLESLKDTPVVLLNGSRQVGKSTFVKSLLRDTHQYITLDDPTTLSSIKKDPTLFLQGLESPVIIDEIQRAPEIFLPLKKNVDDTKRFGYFVLTGSANVLSLPRLGDSLAGRMEIHTLWPLSYGEMHGVKEDFVSFLFGENLKLPGDEVQPSNLSLSDTVELMCRGGYPESVRRETEKRRQRWFSSYITMVLEKDVRDLSNIEGLSELPNLMQLMANRVGTLLNTSEVSRSLRLPNTTLKRYLSLLENLFLLVIIPPWAKNATKRLVKSPKIYLNDTGLLLHLTGHDNSRLLEDKNFLGHVFENFIVLELLKQMTWSEKLCRMYHYRTHSGQEVDVVIEAQDSQIVAIEIKLANTVTSKDFSGIIALEEETGSRFHRGIVLYLGQSVIPFGPNKHAVPLQLMINQNLK